MAGFRYAVPLSGILLLAACGERAPAGFQGYAEGEYVLELSLVKNGKTDVVSYGFRIVP